MTVRKNVFKAIHRVQLLTKRVDSWVFNSWKNVFKVFYRIQPLTKCVRSDAEFQSVPHRIQTLSNVDGLLRRNVSMCESLMICRLEILCLKVLNLSWGSGY